MERESFKEYSEAAAVDKKRALIDKILLRGTSYVFINAARYFFFGSQNRRSEIFKQPRDLTVKEIAFFDGNLC